MQFSRISEAAKHAGKEMQIRGWVHRQRASKEVVFIVLRDVTGLMQCVVKKTHAQFAEADKIQNETSIEVAGKVRKDERAPGGYELEVTEFRVVGPSDKFPISKDLSDEFLLDVRHLWLRSQKMIAVMKIRSTVVGAIHNYFRERRFYEFDPPIFTRSGSEGGSTLFEVDYFDQPAYLSQSWQLYAEAGIMALEKIYCVAPSFRAEKSKTARHLTEFWHNEMEAAWMRFDELQETLENLVSRICQDVAQQNAKELEFLGQDAKKLAKIKPPFPRITYEEALKILEKDGSKKKYGEDLGAPEEKTIGKHFDKPLFITRYPSEIMAFYKLRDPQNPRVCLNANLIAPGVGEIADGSERESDVKKITEILRKEGVDLKAFDWYLDSRRYGSVPHSGFGLGIERVVMWICGLDSIKDAVAFPRTLERCEP